METFVEVHHHCSLISLNHQTLLLLPDPQKILEPVSATPKRQFPTTAATEEDQSKLKRSKQICVNHIDYLHLTTRSNENGCRFRNSV